MSEHSTEKVPITDREYLWAKNVDTGEVALHVGPTQFQPSAADRIVIDDGKGGFQDAPTATPRKMVEVADGQYAVIFNPVAEFHGEPNGPFKEGKNTTVPLQNGTKAMVPGPCAFYLRPGQRCEVRDAHRLEANEYVVVEVQGRVDTESAYYGVTAKAAKITTAIDAERDSGAMDDAPPVEHLRLGQRIVITGLATNFYIPPSGIDVVPDTSVDASGRKLTPDVARRMLKKMTASAVMSASGPAGRQETWMSLGDPNMVKEQLANYAALENQNLGTSTLGRRGITKGMADQSNRGRHVVTRSASMGDDEYESYGAAEYGSESDRRSEEARAHLEHMMQNNPQFQQAVQQEARKAALVRRAVVLSEKEFCVLIDEDGKRQVKQGPARVFPGPYDRFQTEGSRKRVYDAYELLPQRALWLRVITSITRETLQGKLPYGTKLEKDVYNPGDELLVHGVSAFFFPFNEVEVLNAEGKAVVGNDHTDVLIEEIGIDQKSGIYVRDLMTGEVRTVKGKTSYLVDPRKEVQIFRIVSAYDWNLWIGEQEPHKRTEDEVRTPWALSITIPHNMAVLATSAEGQRVIEGPCVALLDYEEKLAILKLSKGRPKDARQSLRTCFLRVRGNRVSDMIEFETFDSVPIRVVVSYTITFLQEHKEMWFNHMNYVQLLANQLRSLLRGNLRKIDFLTLWPRLEDEVRDVILGAREDGGGRPGRTFEIDNGMHVLAVDVIDSEIRDPHIAEQMQRVQQTSVTLRIGDREAQDQLKSDELRAEISDKTRDIRAVQFRKNKEDEGMRSQVNHERELDEIEKRWQQRDDKRQREETEQAKALEAELARAATRTEAENERIVAVADAKSVAANKLHVEEQSHAMAMAGVEQQLITAQSNATVAERQAVQPGLIEALSGFGQAQLAGKAAENMGLISLVKGEDAMSLLQRFFGNSKTGQMVQKMRDKFTGVVEVGDNGKQHLPRSTPHGGDPRGGSPV